MNLNIKIIKKKIDIINHIESIWGEITINDFTERFVMPLEYWKIEDYQRQWKEGLERIKKLDQSCLVTAVQDPNKAPLINIWGLYKEKDKIFIRNYLFFGKKLLTKLKKQSFTFETCYKFIPKKRIIYDFKPSEWVIELE